MRLFLSFILILASLAGLRSQSRDFQNKVVASNAEGNAVLVKWFTKHGFTSEPVNVYRREKGIASWNKLTTSPLSGKSQVEMENKPQVVDALESVIKDGMKPEDFQSFVLMALVVNSIQYQAFAEFLGIIYTDRSVAAGAEYEYKVALVNAGGQEEEIGISNIVRAGNYQPVTAPQNPHIQVSDSIDYRVEMNWKLDVTSYFAVNAYKTNVATKARVKVNKEPILASRPADAPADYQPALMFFEDSVAVGKYIYELYAIDFFGREGVVSQPFEIEIRDMSPPEAVYDLDAVRLDSRKLMITWALPEKTANIQGYDVYIGRFEKGSMETELIKRTSVPLASTATEFEFIIDEFGTFYYQVITAGNNGIYTPSPARNIDVLDNEPPAVPSGLKVAGEEGNLILKWEKNTEKDLLGYIVFRSTVKENIGDYVRITAEPFREPEFGDDMPKNARNTFFYRLAAIDTSFNMSALSEAVGGKMPDVTPPEPLVISEVEVKKDSIVISWLPSLDEDIMGYELYETAGEEKDNWSLLHSGLLPPGGLSFSDGQFEPEKEYSYKIHAVDSVGNKSLQSNIYTIKTRVVIPEINAPAEFSVKYRKNKKRVEIDWKAAKDDSLIGSIVYRQEVGIQNVVEPYSEMVSGSSFVDENLDPGKSYAYQVRIYYQSGGKAASEVKTVEIPSE